MNALSPKWIAVSLFTAAIALAGCETNNSSPAPAPAAGAPIVSGVPGGIGSGSTTNSLTVRDVNGAPIAGAVVTVTGSGTDFQATTDANGVAALSGAPDGEVTMSVSAPAFEPVTFRTRLPRGVTSLSLRAEGEWALGRPIALGAHALARAADGSTLTFSVDVAVLGSSAAAIETLTSSDFEVVGIDCGWGGPRDCASDATGGATGKDGVFVPDGRAESFALQPPAARRSYLVGVLAERSTAIRDWDARGPALRSFFTALGGNDVASLAVVERLGDATTSTVLGPFTSDGRRYFDAIERLGSLTGETPPALLESIIESIYRAAAVTASSLSDVDPTVLVLGTPWMTTAEIDAASALARERGVRISVVVQDNHGLPEMAVRTGGFVAPYEDPRQLGIIFHAMDALLAGTTPYYRMQFRIKGTPNTFVSGGNAKVRLRVRVPTEVPTRGSILTFDVPIGI